MGKIFFTGDLHFGHANVIAFDNRPFKTVEEMDAKLIRRWNNKVGNGDLTYVLGDMIWKARNDDAPELIKSLNGQIILIKGNHDRFLHNAKAKAALAGIKDYDDICVSLEDGTKKRVILSHYFTPMYNGHRYQAIHLHAHSHFTDEADFEVDYAKRLNSIGCRNEIYNVGCMYWNYEPVTLTRLLSMEGQYAPPMAKGLLNIWHSSRGKRIKPLIPKTRLDGMCSTTTATAAASKPSMSSNTVHSVNM